MVDTCHNAFAHGMCAIKSEPWDGMGCRQGWSMCLACVRPGIHASATEKVSRHVKLDLGW
jgi:hypothetical protein